MEKLVFSAKKVVTTTIDFFPLTHHPKALLAKVRGERNYEFITPLATLKHLLKKGGDPEEVADFYLGERPHTIQSLFPNAQYWLVPRKALLEEEGSKSLFDYYQELLDHVEDPDWVPIHKSGSDHQVWDIHEKPVLMPIAVELWGTRFDLKAVEAHLEKIKHPGVLSFTIEPNTCYPNWGISGRYQGKLVLDTAKLGIDFKGVKGECLSQRSTPRAIRSWLEDYVVNSYEGEYDVLGLKAFKIKDRVADDEDED